MNGDLILGFYHTPLLWKDKLAKLKQFEFAKLTISEQPILEIPEKLRLGHQMEYIFKHLVKTSTSFELIASNLVVEENKRTIGELDFIIRDKTSDTLFHIELAYKFYIIHDSGSSIIEKLIGPNRSDTFAQKLDKLQNSQMPLLHHQGLESTWEELQISPKTMKQRCCFKAQLFAPFFWNTTAIHPLNSDCIKGRWVSFSNFNTLFFKNAVFHLLTKKEWVITPHNQVQWITHTEILYLVEKLHQKERSPMLWMNNENGQLLKLFVVWW